MSEKKQKPQIRFKGFTDDWEQHKLGDITDDIADGPFGSNLKAEHYTNEKEARIVQLSNIGEAGWQDENVKYTTFSHAKEIARSIVTSGNLIMAKMMPAGMTIICPNIDKMYVLSSDAVKIKLKKNINATYFISMTKSNNFLQQIDSDSQGSTRTRTSISKIRKMDIPLPELCEQEKIGKYFSTIDNLITLHQRKYEKLLTMKKSCLEKMFPKNENKIPEIRFKRFADNWEQHKLSSIATMHARIGWQNLRTSEFLDSGNYYLITGTDFINGKIDFNTCHFVEKERYDQDKNIQVKNGSILITKDGTLGKVAYIDALDKPATLNAGVFNVTIIDKKFENKYLFQYLKAPFLMDYVMKRATGGTIKHLNQNILVDFPILHPSYDEQSKLGTFFSKLDNLITLHQRKVKMFQNIKKSCLEKMFVQ